MGTRWPWDLEGSDSIASDKASIGSRFGQDKDKERGLIKNLPAGGMPEGATSFQGVDFKGLTKNREEGRNDVSGNHCGEMRKVVCFCA
jgi:hypothetical protein